MLMLGVPFFTGQTWIKNGATPAHCDCNGFMADFDHLSVHGTAKAKLKLCDIGVQLDYSPGCVVGVALCALLACSTAEAIDKVPI